MYHYGTLVYLVIPYWHMWHMSSMLQSRGSFCWKHESNFQRKNSDRCSRAAVHPPEINNFLEIYCRESKPRNRNTSKERIKNFNPKNLNWVRPNTHKKSFESFNLFWIFPRIQQKHVLFVYPFYLSTRVAAKLHTLSRQI